jgi:AAHS family benzoate transporter-like MFS transporter
MSTRLPSSQRASSAPEAGPTRRSAGRPADFWPVLLCWVAVALDGFDLVVLGVVIPTLLGTGALGFTESTVTTASTLGLVGMGVGALTIGPLTDRFGRRTTLITSVAAFSVFTIATGLSQSVGQFTTFRFLAGLGLGACLPTALAFMTEHAKTGRGGSAVTRMMTGYHVGAVLTALLALQLVDDYGWESMFFVGGVLGLLTVPVMWAKLPESEAYLRAAGSREVPRCSGDATSGSASVSARPRSWACCWSTGSTPGSRRSWERPGTPSRRAPR